MAATPQTIMAHDFPASPVFSDDEIVQLREWGTERTCKLSPRPPQDSTVKMCALRVGDVEISSERIELIHDRNQWRIQAREKTAGLRQDGELRQRFILTPGVEVGIGTTTLIAESLRFIALRGFCALVLGWGASRMRAVDLALRAIRLAAAARSSLVLHGGGDLVPLAYALHHRVLGAPAPFVVCDPRRKNQPVSNRAPANRRSALAAFEMAAGGSLCVSNRRWPPDMRELLELRHQSDRRVQLIVCTQRPGRDQLLSSVMPIHVPSLRARETELSRIVHEYAGDALAALSAPDSAFSDEDLRWVMQGARSLSEIEKATLRVVALNVTHNVRQAARLLGIAAVSLSRWLDLRMPRARPDRC